MIPPWIAFLAWMPLTLYCFRRYPVRVAILINFFAGWALLPAACFEPTTAIFPYWILGADLPSTYFFTKASVTAICGLAGMIYIDKGLFRRLDPSFWDLPMAVWCFLPLVSAIIHSQNFLFALRSELYQCLAWGVPYCAGRLYFKDTIALRMAAKAIVLAGVAYVPVCLLEIVTGPQVYAFLYGYEPYRWIGAQRYLGYRPIGLLEDGNQLGIWMAGSALMAIWLWRHRLIDSIAGINMAWIAGTLFVVTLMCQSAGSIVLLLGLLLFVFIRTRYLPRVLAGLLLVGIIAGLALRVGNIVSLRSIVEHNRLAYEVARSLKELRLGSFGWRLSQDERHVAVALQTPILGSGQWDWWRASASRPWSLWLLAFGMYGLVGLLALESLQLLPIVRVGRATFVGRNSEGLEIRTALIAVVLMTAVDNLLNGSMILPLLLVIGGLSGPESTLELSRSQGVSRQQRTSEGAREHLT